LLLCPPPLSLFFPLSPYPFRVNGVSRLIYRYFNIWRGGPPGRRTDRPTWQVQFCTLIFYKFDFSRFYGNELGIR